MQNLLLIVSDGALSCGCKAPEPLYSIQSAKHDLRLFLAPVLAAARLLKTQIETSPLYLIRSNITIGLLGMKNNCAR